MFYGRDVAGLPKEAHAMIILSSWDVHFRVVWTCTANVPPRPPARTCSPTTWITIDTTTIMQTCFIVGVLIPLTVIDCTSRCMDLVLLLLLPSVRLAYSSWTCSDYGCLLFIPFQNPTTKNPTHIWLPATWWLVSIGAAVEALSIGGKGVGERGRRTALQA
jgi:hypothetical protein